ncbi:MAG: TetR/AcrR family transcriptional regulator [Pseudomonadota bacterium]
MTRSDTLKKNDKRYHHGDLRDALLEAIRMLVERDGADNFKISEACRIAGVTTAAPYKHFRDRDDILRAVALAGMQRFGKRMSDASQEHDPGMPKRIEALGQAYLDFAEAEPGIFRMMFGLSEHHAGDPELEETGKATTDLLESVVAEHLNLPPESTEVRLRSYALWCFVHGHCFLRMDGKFAEKYGQLEETEILAAVGKAMMRV